MRRSARHRTVADRVIGLVRGGFADFGGPFRWRVEALGEAGRHDALIKPTGKDPRDREDPTWD